jgi:hypothetical protein
LLCFTFFAPVYSLAAQTGHFVQRLTWEPDAAAAYYEVLVERLSQNSEEVLRETTEQPFLDCSLPAGRYRYQVRVYNLFGRMGASSEWSAFEVVQRNATFVQRLSWELDPGASYYEVVVEQRGSDSQYRELARKITEESFAESALPVGQYRYQVTVYDVFGRGVASEWSYFEVLLQPETPAAAPTAASTVAPAAAPAAAQNVAPPRDTAAPSAVAAFEAFELKSEQEMNSVMRSTYSPFIPLADSASLFPAGVSVGLGWLLVESEVNAFCIEFGSSLNYQTGTGVVLWNVHFSLVYQQYLASSIMALNFRLGGGISLLYRSSGESGDSQAWLPALSGGISFQWAVYKPFFVTTGVDFAYLFAPNGLPIYVWPSLGFGRRF